MFMKCFKKKLATSLLVASMVFSFSWSAFAVELDVARENTYGSKMYSSYIKRIIMSNGDACYIVAMTAGFDSSISCFSKQIENNNVNDKIDNIISRLEKLEANNIDQKKK